MLNKKWGHQINLINGFSMKEKIILRFSFFGFLLAGAYGIFVESFSFGLVYFTFVLIALIFIVLPSLCAHCPYPYKYEDCLFFPYKWVKKLYKYREEPMSVVEKIGWILMTLNSFIFPQYWLFKNFNLLIIFWLVISPMAIAIPFYYCKRCRHLHCPYNRVDNDVKAANEVVKCLKIHGV